MSKPTIRFVCPRVPVDAELPERPTLAGYRVEECYSPETAEALRRVLAGCVTVKRVE
jgi:hypothetical protein